MEDSTSWVMLESQVPFRDLNATTPWSLATTKDQFGNKRNSNDLREETLRAPSYPDFRDRSSWGGINGTTVLSATTKIGLGVVGSLDEVEHKEELLVPGGLCAVDDDDPTSPVCQSLNVLNSPYTCEEVCQQNEVSCSFA